MRLVDFEKLLPEDLPAGERVLWHGRPDWKSLARRGFRADLVATYFGAMAVWNVATMAYDGGAAAIALTVARTLVPGIAALGLLALLAFLSSRTTLYVITNRRVVMKIGIALPIFLNLPYREIVSASRCTYADGTGDLPMALSADRRVAYLHLWPHARPFRFKHPEPALRCIPQAEAVSEIFSRALIEASNERLVPDARQPATQEGVQAGANDRHPYPAGIAAA